jgi:hypothetical protein
MTSAGFPLPAGTSSPPLLPLLGAIKALKHKDFHQKEAKIIEI